MSRRRWYAGIVLLAGFATLIKALWIPAKAWLAGALIAMSWQASSQEDQPVLPWPWADTWAIAKLSVPELALEQYVFRDASGESLAFGPGVVPYGDSVGTPAHQVIAGHRDTHFAFLEDLKLGDLVAMETYQGLKTRYAVTDVEVINTLREALLVDREQAGLTLVTCWPFNAVLPGGPMRYVVRLRPIKADREKQLSSS